MSLSSANDGGIYACTRTHIVNNAADKRIK